MRHAPLNYGTYFRVVLAGWNLEVLQEEKKYMHHILCVESKEMVLLPNFLMMKITNVIVCVIKNPI